MADCLSQLKNFTTVVADTGDFASIKQFQPQDSTTNPSLILAASKQSQYEKLIHQAIEEAHGDPSSSSSSSSLEDVLDHLLVVFGTEILKVVPGRVSTEVDARLSFDTEATIKKATKLMSLYEKKGIGKDRVLIKIASTWEGIKAAEILERDHGIHCNLTLLFSFVQAVACAEAKVTLISPFVGRILDWYSKANNRTYTPQEDPGVESVRNIFNYYRKYDYPTIVMGASFRNVGEIKELAGCDFLTIGPSLLKELQDSKEELPRKLTKESAKKSSVERVSYDEKGFRWNLNEDAMATEKLSEGIRKFAADTVELEKLLQKYVDNNPNKRPKTQ